MMVRQRGRRRLTGYPAFCFPVAVVATRTLASFSSRSRSATLTVVTTESVSTSMVPAEELWRTELIDDQEKNEARLERPWPVNSARSSAGSVSADVLSSFMALESISWVRNRPSGVTTKARCHSPRGVGTFHVNTRLVAVATSTLRQVFRKVEVCNYARVRALA